MPHVIEECLTEIEHRGLTEVGICKLSFHSSPLSLNPFLLTLVNLGTLDRIAGATLEINALKESFNQGESPVTASTDIHAVCDLVKSWFRVLPEPVFPPDSYYEVMEAMRASCLSISH